MKSKYQPLIKLQKSAAALNEIVEGVRSERWAARGVRLKDTPEWTDFYVKLKRAEERPAQLPEST